MDKQWDIFQAFLRAPIQTASPRIQRAKFLGITEGFELPEIGRELIKHFSWPDIKVLMLVNKTMYESIRPLIVYIIVDPDEEPMIGHFHRAALDTWSINDIDPPSTGFRRIGQIPKPFTSAVTTVFFDCIDGSRYHVDLIKLAVGLAALAMFRAVSRIEFYNSNIPSELVIRSTELRDFKHLEELFVRGCPLLTLNALNFFENEAANLPFRVNHDYESSETPLGSDMVHNGLATLAKITCSKVKGTVVPKITDNLVYVSHAMQVYDPRRWRQLLHPIQQFIMDYFDVDQEFSRNLIMSLRDHRNLSLGEFRDNEVRITTLTDHFIRQYYSQNLESSFDTSALLAALRLRYWASEKRLSTLFQLRSATSTPQGRSMLYLFLKDPEYYAALENEHLRAVTSVLMKNFGLAAAAAVEELYPWESPRKSSTWEVVQGYSARPAQLHPLDRLFTSPDGMPKDLLLCTICSTRLPTTCFNPLPARGVRPGCRYCRRSSSAIEYTRGRARDRVTGIQNNNVYVSAAIRYLDAARLDSPPNTDSQIVWDNCNNMTPSELMRTLIPGVIVPSTATTSIGPGKIFVHELIYAIMQGMQGDSARARAQSNIAFGSGYRVQPNDLPDENALTAKFMQQARTMQEEILKMLENVRK
jgi:hypothetical protein